MQSFDVFFDVNLNMLVNKQFNGYWFEIPWFSFEAFEMIYPFS